ncbi:putative colanic acid polymerase WcaD [Anopheles sinensis]|uniref:Putative colanic acid polymerase WcaD n=1 Tax=Anopheles sinensis TaxID=74873 RepID=A0A084VFV9_ANOSI|nr:putative colanic acid polymerase WcaD [Anopheles sinensis]
MSLSVSVKCGRQGECILTASGSCPSYCAPFSNSKCHTVARERLRLQCRGAVYGNEFDMTCTYVGRQMESRFPCTRVPPALRMCRFSGRKAQSRIECSPPPPPSPPLGTSGCSCEEISQNAYDLPQRKTTVRNDKAVARMMAKEVKGIPRVKGVAGEILKGSFCFRRRTKVCSPENEVEREV